MSGPRFTPLPSGKKTAYITFSSGIDAGSEGNLIQACGNAISQGAEAIYLMISSPGGAVIHGINIYAMLRALPVRLITHNIASVDSIGIIVFLAGQERYASAHSTFLFHGVQRNFPKGAAVNISGLHGHLDSLEADHKKIAAIVDQRTNITEKEMLKLMEHQTTRDVKYAESKKLIHGVRNINIQKEGMIHYILPAPPPQNKEQGE